MTQQQLSREEILEQSVKIARDQLGGTLATMHAEDGTPYVTFVLFHILADGRLLFGSGASPQHSRNIHATPEVSFLIDNREAIRTDWSAFNRVVVEGRAREVEDSDPEYESFMAEIREKNPMAAFFTERGALYCIDPRRFVLMRGFEPARHVIDF